MLNLHESYKKIKPSVVAIISHISTRNDFPEIIGTGVAIDKNGLILTNNHVANALFKLPRKKDAPKDWPASILFLHNDSVKGLFQVPIQITGVAKIGFHDRPENYYGSDQIDLAFITIGKVTNIPVIEIADKDLGVGCDVGILGFPMGTDTFSAPGWVHQITPTLQKGIVSAQLPFDCDAPHEIMIDAVTEGGSSGSPIFDPQTAQLVGLLYGGLKDYNLLRAHSPDGSILRYSVPTSHTLAISNFWIRTVINKIHEENVFDSKEETRMDFMTYINQSPALLHKSGTNHDGLHPISETEIIFPRAK